MEENKNTIMNLLLNEETIMDATSISKVTKISLEKTCEALRELENEKRLVYTKKGKYKRSPYIFGKLSSVKSGAGFVIAPNEKDVYIGKDNLNNAIHGDSVVVEITDKEKNEGKVLKINAREKKFEVGEIIEKNGTQFIKLDDVNKRNITLVVPDDNHVVGQKVKVKIGKALRNNVFKGNDLKVIGHVNDPGVDILSKAIMFNIKTEFPEEVLKEADNTKTAVTKQDIVGRKDCRDERIVTIDGDDAKDLDDAVLVKKLPNGNYQLGVFIADVSHYVRKNSALDKEAFERGTSNYLVDKVIPMLPHKLSNGICSLHAGVDRLTKACIMEFRPDGHLVDYNFYNSVINSKKRMTYKKVNDCLQDQNIDPEYEPFIEDLKIMNELATILKNKRKERGSISFDTNEMEIIVDENGHAKDVVLRERQASENLIEEFMIAANETVATHFKYFELPCIYRTHDQPSIDRLEEFKVYAKSMGEKVMRLPEELKPKAIQQILETLEKDSPDFEIYSMLMLKAMSKARYEVNSNGHFGLASTAYTHFTSPIRRYPDLEVHRCLDSYLNNNFSMSGKDIDRRNESLRITARHSTLKEIDADRCEREVNKMKAAEYMEDHIGETYIGKVTSIKEYGYYVDIYNSVEGLVKTNSSNGEYFDKEKLRMVTPENYIGIGDMVETVVKNANKDLCQIDLSYIGKVDKEKALTLRKEL